MKHWSRAGEPSSNLVTTQLEGDMKNLRSVTGPLTFPQNVIARSGHILRNFLKRTLSNPDKITQNLQNVIVNSLNRMDSINPSKVVVKNGHVVYQFYDFLFFGG